MIHDHRMPITGFHFACRVTIPMPNSQPTLTWVVLTGRP